MTCICKCAEIYPVCHCTSHRPTQPCSCAAGQLSHPSPSGSLVLTIEKKLPAWSRQDIIVIMTAELPQNTQCADCSAEEEGANTVCSMCATQYYHSPTMAHPHSPDPSFYICHVSIKQRTNTSFYRAQPPYTTAL